MEPSLPPGYRRYPYDDPFEDHVGPFGYKVEDGRVAFAVQTDARHRNTGGTVHGGMLMTFADFALCLVAVWDQPGERCVTVSCHSDFVAAAQPGDLIEASGEVVRRTRSLTFVRGQLTAGDRVLLAFSGIVKRIPSQTGPQL